ncbi:MAG: C10 family peptidase [Anaerolineae bacterium]
MNKTTRRHGFAKGLVPFFIVALALALNLGQPPLVARADDGTVTPQEARRAALAWLNVCPGFVGTAYGPAPGMLEIKDEEQKQTIAYVLELQPRGFIIVTPRRELNPIIAYSENSVFDATEAPENILLDLLRGDIRERLQALEKGVISSSYREVSRSRWKNYLQKVDEQGRVRSEGAPLRILQSYDVEHGPFLTSEWGQSTDGGGNAAFNYYTPPGPDGDSDNYVCGCVATAFGQILNYYEWPETGTGSHSYSWNSETLSADFGATTYDWDNVLDIYGGGGKTMTETQAVGTVTYHAGVAVEMDYGSGGSAAYTSDVAGALQNHFRATGAWVSGTESNFYDRLYANMINHRPGELSIHDTVPPVTAGHAVVVDGVRHNTGSTKYYHLNMGWNGTADAWYDIANPFTTGSYTWDTVNGCVLDVVPTPNLDDPGTTTTGAAIPVFWDVADLQGASRYELQQAAIPDTLGSFTDDAESGTGNWAIDGHWEQSGYTSHSPSNSFHGDLYDGSTWEYPGTFALERAAKIGASTTIAYWWRLRLFENYEARFQIADAGTNEKNWTTLKTYTSTGDTSWALETVSTADLAAYVGEVVSLRFVIDYLGGSIYYGSAGFYFDDFTINDGYIGSDWTTIDDNITTERRTVPVTEGGDYCYRVRAHGCDPSAQPSCSGEWWDWSDVESITVVSDAYASAAAGNWSEGSTWEGGSVPPAGSSAIIKNGHTVTVDGNRQCNDLVIESGGELVVSNGVNLSMAGDWVNDGTFTPNNGTVTFNGSSAQAIGGDSTFYNLTSANTAGGVTAGDGALTVSNLLHVQSDTFTSASDLADVQIDSGAILALSGDITVSGSWTNNGTFTHNNHDVTFDGSSAQTVSGSSATGFNSLTVDSGATVIMETMPTVAATLTSNGTLRQTRDVNGSSDVSFLDTGGYGGVIINANGSNLDSTIVTIRGNQDCTGTAGETVKRCFDIAPINHTDRNATITFYFDSDELTGTDSTCDTLNPYHLNGSSWEALTLDTSYDDDGRLCGSDPQSIRVIGVSSFSSFVTKSGGPPGGDPTAVVLASVAATFQRFGAGAAGSAQGFVLALVLLALGVVGGVLQGARRRTTTD